MLVLMVRVAWLLVALSPGCHSDDDCGAGGECSGFAGTCTCGGNLATGRAGEFCQTSCGAHGTSYGSPCVRAAVITSARTAT